jgi:hypothetical protein
LIFKNIEFRSLLLRANGMLKHSLGLISILLMGMGIAWQLPAIGEPPTDFPTIAPAQPASSRYRPSANGARVLGHPEIGLKSLFAATPTLKSNPIQSIHGGTVKAYIRFEPSAERVWESLPRPDSGLQLKIGGSL